MDLDPRHGVPYKGGTLPLTKIDEDDYSKELVGWRLARDGTHRLIKEIKFPKYMDGVNFVREVGVLADAKDHHPDIHLYYKKVVIELYTHAVDGLSVNDFILAAKIDKLQG
jgi:4a-hydroxytetrahydrobiopterin dehydratase